MSHKKGDKIGLTAYHEAARIECVDGLHPDRQSVVVVHNESSHFLIAVSGIDPQEGEFIKSFSYLHTDNQSEISKIYAVALLEAAAIALSN